MDKTHLASAVCHMVKERLLHGDAVGRKVMSRKSYQQKVATMAGAPLKAWYGVTELHEHSLKLPEVKGVIIFTLLLKTPYFSGVFFLFVCGFF